MRQKLHPDILAKAREVGVDVSGLSRRRAAEEIYLQVFRNALMEFRQKGLYLHGQAIYKERDLCLITQVQEKPYYQLWGNVEDHRQIIEALLIGPHFLEKKIWCFVRGSPDLFTPCPKSET